MTPPQEQPRAGADNPAADSTHVEDPRPREPEVPEPELPEPEVPGPAVAGPEQRETLRGPHLPPILLGLAALSLAVVVLGQELADLTVDWVGLGPLAIVAAGLVLVVLGGAGLAGSGRRRRP